MPTWTTPAPPMSVVAPLSPAAPGWASAVVALAVAAVLLHEAHRDLTCAASSPDLRQFSAAATDAFIGVIEGGGWFSPLREALDAYVKVVDLVQEEGEDFTGFD